MVTRKSPAEIELMATAGRVLAAVHELLAGVAEPGVTTGELDRIAELQILRCGALPSFKGYRGYPATLNTSINDQIVHAIPSDDVTLRTGDVLSIDGGVLLDGYHADSAWTTIVGGRHCVPDAVADLVDDTREAMWRGITALVVGNRLGDVSAAIGEVGSARGYGVIAEHDGHVLGGHGIGRRLRRPVHPQLWSSWPRDAPQAGSGVRHRADVHPRRARMADHAGRLDHGNLGRTDRRPLGAHRRRH